MDNDFSLLLYLHIQFTHLLTLVLQFFFLFRSYLIP
jgi:hypothetical protein